MNLGLWLRALRVKFLAASVIPVLLGTLVALNSYGSIDFIIFFATLVGVVSIHLAANLSNDYFDYKSGADDLNKSGSEFSGGSQVIQEGLISAKQILHASYTFFGIGLILGIFLALKIGSIRVLFLGLIGAFIGYFYTSDPLKLSYNGFAEVSNVIIFGPMIGLGTYYVQTKTISYEIIIASLILGILLGLVLLINEFPDFKSDRDIGKNTLVVRIGRKKARWIFIIILISTYLYQIIWTSIKVLPIHTLITLTTAPITYKIVKTVKNEYKNYQKFKNANKYMIQLHLIYGLLMSLGYLINIILT